MELAQRLQVPGHVSTCSDKFLKNRPGGDLEDEDIIEPQIGVSDIGDDIAEELGFKELENS